MESEDARTGGNLSVSAGAKYRRELSNDKVACIWAESVPVELQTRLLRMIHNLSLTFAAMWQAVDHPTRAFDAERSVVALCMLALFDASATEEIHCAIREALMVYCFVSDDDLQRAESWCIE